MRVMWASSGFAVFAAFQFSTFFSIPLAEAFPIQFGLSPDNSQSLLIHTIDSADKEILINMYQWDSPEIQKAVIAKIAAGVTVRILLEGQPMGKISANGESTLHALAHAMHSSRNKQDRFFLMTEENGKTRRYRFDHAKYVVIDGQKVLVASENFTTTGHPNAGYVGNRGWEAVLEDPSLAHQFSTMFDTDTSLQYGDIRDVTHSSDDLDQSSGTDSNPKIRHIPAIPSGQGEAQDVTLVTSPDSQAGIVSFIRSAKQTLEIEQMSMPSDWKDKGSTDLSPFVSEAMAAAKRGVKVRVLLNDDTVFGEDPSADSDSKTANQDTVIFLKKFAHCARVDLDARIVDVKALEITYIHNKGMIADGKRVFVSSINGTRNAVMNNRETAVNLESSDAAAYFESAFDFDWKKTKSLEAPLETETCGSQLSSIELGL